MSKKVLQRSLVLGALMTFVITGNVWAENSGEGSLSSNGGDYGIEAGKGNVVELDALELYVTNTIDRDQDNYFAIRATETGNVTVKNLNATVVGKEWSAGVEATHDAIVNLGNVTLNVSDGGTEGCEAYGINVARKGNVNVDGDLIATVSGGEWANAIEAYNGSKVNIGNGSSVVTLTAVTNSNEFRDREWGIRAHGIFAVGQLEDIQGENEDDNEIAYGESIVDINAEKLTIKTTSNIVGAHSVGIYAEDNSVVKVNSDVDINANGYYAYGVEAINGSDIELGGDDKEVSIIASCKGDNDGNRKTFAVYADGENSKIDIIANKLTVETKRVDNTDPQQQRRSLLAQNGAVINVTANEAELNKGRILALWESTINIDAKIKFQKNTPFDVRDDSKINLIGGEMSGVLNIEKGNVNLTGATFTAVRLFDSDVYDNVDDSNILGNGKLVVDDNGILKTKASEVFDYNGDKCSETIVDSIRENNKVVYKAGAVSLSEDYSYSFLESALRTMKAHEYESGKTSSTKIIMTGVLKEETLTAFQASSLGNQVELDTVTVKTENNNLLVGANIGDGNNGETVDGVTVTSGVVNGFSANGLDLGNANGAIITGGQELTLGGSDGNANLVSTSDASKSVKIVVGGNVSNSNGGSTGKLNIGNAAANENSEYKLDGSVKVNQQSELNTKGKTIITGGVELDGGNIDVHKDGHLNADVSVKGISKITGKVTGDLEVENGHPSTMIHLGNENKAGKMNAEHSKLKGGTLFLDPAYANGIEYASAFALGNASDLDGAYIAGQNSVISFGVNDTDAAEKVFDRTGLTFGSGNQNGHTVTADVNAVVYINGSTSVANGSITADGELTTGDISSYTNSLNAGTVKFADGSLLMVEADKVNSEFAITNVTNVSIAGDAKLYIDDAEKNKTYKILKGANINSAWAEEDVFTNGNLVTFKVVLAEDGTAYEVNTGLQKVRDVYGDEVIIADVVDNSMLSETVATKFFGSAVDSKVNIDKVAQIDALNSIGAMNEVAGVTHTTYAVSNILTDAVADHMSLANGKDHDKDIWAHYVHTKEDVDGLKYDVHSTQYSAQYNGIVVGSDLYKEDKATVGAALTYVDGNINGSSVAARTENDAKYYGASIYGSIKNNDTAVIADVSYLHSEHDIIQRNSGKVITGEPETDAFSVGVRVEKEAKAGIGKLVPYAGLRYMHLGTGNYTNSIGLAYDADDAELFLLPVGLKYSADIKNTNGWTMRPVMEFGYVWAFGDTDANQTVSLNGASNSFGYDVTDSGSYVGRFMLEAEKANISYALGYEYQKGDDVKADKWMFNVNWKF